MMFSQDFPIKTDQNAIELAMFPAIHSVFSHRNIIETPGGAGGSRPGDWLCPACGDPWHSHRIYWGVVIFSLGFIYNLMNNPYSQLLG
jgi:hypothetical protein